MQVFLLPFAGGNCYSYGNIVRKLKTLKINAIPLELPGRGLRLDEPLLNSMKEVINDYLSQIKNLRDGKPYVIYGHSMGATVGFYITQILEISNDTPLALVVSGNPGPNMKKVNSIVLKGKRETPSDEELKEKLRSLGGVHEKILQEDEIFNFFKKSIRSDFMILENDHSLQLSAKKINVPIYAMMGDNEEEVERITSWKYLTDATFEYKIFKGNHFFINNHPDEIVQILWNNLHSTRIE